MADKTVVIDLVANDKASGALKSAGGAADDTGSKFGTLAKVGAAAFAAIAAGAIAVGVKSVVAFTGFEKQMNEVFTLLPGISEKAMGDMTDQVKDFSKEFGVLPDKVVPALYQAISAGVPKDNVFTFLETAQKAAKGGVTDLTTAVDGISSVVNAYGSDVVDATKASDLMFTAVRLGKTNFEELSASLFQVIPTASSLGVQFGDVTAALASMTAQGVPTSVATTQLRQLFVELSKAGTKTSAAFEAMGDQTFKEFIASGGNVEGALERLQWAVEEGFAPSIADLFGSVEAGQAALALTGKGAKTFGNNLAEMGKAAGATEAAYKQMDRGLSASFDRIKAHAAVFMLEVGQRLAPVIEMAMQRAGEAFAILSDWWAVNGPGIIAASQMLAAVLVEAFQVIAAAIAFVVENWDIFKFAVAAAVAIMIPHFVALGVAATVSSVQQVAAWVASTAATAAAAVAHSGHVAAMVAKWVLLGAQSLIHAAKVAAAWLISMGPIAIVTAAVVGLVALIVKNWDTIKSVIAAGWNAVKAATVAVWDAIKGLISGALEFIKVLFLNFTGPGLIIKHWNTIRDTTSAIWNGIKDFISNTLGTVVGFISNMPGRIAGAASGMWDGIKEAFRSALNWIIRKWNDLEFTTPSVGFGPFKTPSITLGTPNIPLLHSGGEYRAPTPGGEGFARLRDREMVSTPESMSEVVALLVRIEAAIRRLPRDQQLILRGA